MNNKSTLTMALAAISSIGGMAWPKISKNYSKREVKAFTYKTGGKAFTNGRRQRSLKIRANRRKAKA